MLSFSDMDFRILGYVTGATDFLLDELHAIHQGLLLTRETNLQDGPYSSPRPFVKIIVMLTS